MNDRDAVAAMRAGAARALEQVLRARRPDLAWEVWDPVERHDVPGAPAGVDEVGLEPGRDHADALLKRTAPLPHPDDAKRAA